MTAQVREKIIYEGKIYSMCSCPLSPFLKLSKFKNEFISPHTALWRGYVGTWEILVERLYLVELVGDFADGSLVNLEAIFPGYPNRVFAHWYSGTVRIPQGKILKYVHMGFGSIYELDLSIKIEKGVVVSVRKDYNNV
jgi:hypothetical protein